MNKNLRENEAQITLALFPTATAAGQDTWNLQLLCTVVTYTFIEEKKTKPVS